MSNFERYLILVTMSFFFSFMVLGLISIHRSLEKKNDMYKSLLLRSAVGKLEQAYKDNANCYRDAALDGFILDQGQKNSMVRFLTASLNDKEMIDIYLNGQPDGNGAFFIMRMEHGPESKKGCMVFEGTGMRIALPSPAAGSPGPEASPPQQSNAPSGGVPDLNTR